MATVYLAYDLKPGRRVTLRVVYRGSVGISLPVPTRKDHLWIGFPSDAPRERAADYEFGVRT